MQIITEIKFCFKNFADNEKNKPTVKTKPFCEYGLKISNARYLGINGFCKFIFV